MLCRSSAPALRARVPAASPRHAALRPTRRVDVHVAAPMAPPMEPLRRDERGFVLKEVRK